MNTIKTFAIAHPKLTAAATAVAGAAVGVAGTLLFQRTLTPYVED